MLDAVVELTHAQQEVAVIDDARYTRAAALRKGVVDAIGEKEFSALARHDPKNHFSDLESFLNFLTWSEEIHDPRFLKAYSNFQGRTNVLVNAHLHEDDDEVIAFYAAARALKDATTEHVAVELEKANDLYGGVYEHGLREAIDFLGDGNTAPAMRAVSLFLQHPSQAAWEAVMKTKFDIGNMISYFQNDIADHVVFQGDLNGFAGSALLNLLDNMHKYRQQDTRGAVTRTPGAHDTVTWTVTNESNKPWEDRFAQPKQRAEGNVHGGSGVGISLIQIHAAASGSSLQLPQVGSTKVSFGLTVPHHT